MRLPGLKPPRRRSTEGWLVRVSARLSHGDLDRLGENADPVREALAKRIASATRPGDERSVVARDEYLFVVKPGRRRSDSSDPVPVVRRLLEGFAHPLESPLGPIFPRLNAAFTSSPCETGDERARGALSVALNEAQRAGSGIAIELDTQRGTSRRMTLDSPATEMISTLKRAIDSGKVTMHYQPVVRLSDMRVAAFEALMRIESDEGLISPMRFIGVAESSGLIHELGRIAFAEAASQLSRWRSSCGDAAPERIAVNVSPHQLVSADFVEGVTAAFADAGLDALTLELTETALIHEMPEARKTLERLREAGAWVALDDFGVEYSNLAYLRDLAVDVVKIDRSFLEGTSENRRAATILAKMVELAHLLDAKVVAEGVSTDAQRDVLRDLAIDYAQGSSFGLPMSGFDATKWLRKT